MRSWGRILSWPIIVLAGLALAGCSKALAAPPDDVRVFRDCLEGQGIQAILTHDQRVAIFAGYGSDIGSKPEYVSEWIYVTPADGKGSVRRYIVPLSADAFSAGSPTLIAFERCRGN